MLILGVVILIVGLVLGIPILFTIGCILAALGFVLLVVGTIGGPERRYIGNRRYWY